MSRTNGRKIVSLALGGIVGAIGIGQIYLPYIADRDKLRGLFEEEDMPAEARREMEMIMATERAAQQAMAHSEKNDKKSAGSMWSNLKRSS